MNSSKNIWIDNIKLRYLLFALICFGYMIYGSNITIIGICFQDLSAILDVDSNTISNGITLRYVVNCFSAILAGFSFNYFSRQILYAIALFIYGLMMIILPLIKDVSFYFIASALIGSSSAFIDCVTNLWVFELFTENINFHVLIVHFTYSLGQTVSPLIIINYLSNETDNKLIQETTQIQKPFLICGLLFIISSFLIILCYFIKPYIPPKRFIESKDIVEFANEDDEIMKSPLPRYYYNSFVVIISLILGFEISNELNLNYYLPTYLNKSKLSIDKDTIAYMMSIVGGCYCIGRLLNIFTSLKINVLFMLYVNLILIILGNLILTFLATNSQLYITWISIILLGLGYSSLFPNLFSYVEQRITITNTLNSFLVFVTSSVFTINSLAIGKSIDNNPSLFQTMNLSFAILFVILFLLLHSTDLWKKRILNSLK